MNPNTVEATRPYLTTPDASRRSGFTTSYLARLLKRGTLEGFRLGRDWFVYADSLETYLATPHKPGPQPGSRKGSSDE